METAVDIMDIAIKKHSKTSFHCKKFLSDSAQ
nr:MAG TPA: hypothetical protein [Caudoviricetes sp.]